MSYRALVAHTHPTFLILGLLARLPYAVSPIATLVLLEDATDSVAFAGLAGAAQGIALAAGGPLVGALADRHGHRLVGALCAAANVVALLALLLATDRTGLLLASALTGLTQPPVGSLVRVHWSRVLPRSLVPTAQSYESAADETSFVVGPALAGVLAIVGPAAPVVASMVLTGCATLPFVLFLAGRQPPRDGTTPLPLGGLITLVLAMGGIGAVFGAVQTGVTAHAGETGQPGTAGLLYAELGVGSALVGLACAWLPAGFTPKRRYQVFSATLFVGTAVLLLPLPLPVTMAVTSLAIAPYLLSVYTLTDLLAPPDRATAAMTIVCAAGPLGTAAGRAAAGWLAERDGTTAALAVAPTAAAVALILALTAGRRL